jgi:hypothetical protein
MILTVFFCKVNTILLSDKLPQKIIPSLESERWQNDVSVSLVIMLVYETQQWDLCWVVLLL